VLRRANMYKVVPFIIGETVIDQFKVLHVIVSEPLAMVSGQVSIGQRATDVNPTTVVGPSDRRTAIITKMPVATSVPTWDTIGFELAIYLGGQRCCTAPGFCMSPHRIPRNMVLLSRREPCAAFRPADLELSSAKVLGHRRRMKAALLVRLPNSFWGVPRQATIQRGTRRVITARWLTLTCTARGAVVASGRW